MVSQSNRLSSEYKSSNLQAMNITTSTTPRIFISVGKFLHPACRFEPQPSPTVCLDSGCTYQDVFSEASVYMLSCFDVTSAVLIAQVPPRHKRNALLLRVLLQLLASSKCLTNLCFNEELSCDHFTRSDTIDRFKECVKEKEGVPPVKQRSLELFLVKSS
ncbi:hypothetical protein DY000_02017414 [Brassica cretica]|uniref:Uncharacterized protein n=1 Tax=Brassica cretica TaxID=69181 RepID=A0ABQ7D4J4_BRACR|nr:hypothetical protein DY000_02017414 [Brassica cretica]